MNDEEERKTGEIGRSIAKGSKKLRDKDKAWFKE